MSKAALYQGLGAGLMSFGSNFAHLQAENARARREASLLGLRRQFQLEDQAAAQARQDDLLARQEQQALEREERQFGRQQDLMGLQTDEIIRRTQELQDPEMDALHRQYLEAQIGQMGAQTDYYRSGNRGASGRATRYSDLPSSTRELFTPSETAALLQAEQEGRFTEALGEIGADKDIGPDRVSMREFESAKRELRKEARRQAESILGSAQDFRYMPQEQRVQLGIGENDDLVEARRKLTDRIYESELSFYQPADTGGLLEQAAGPEQIMLEAEQAISAGADPEMVVSRMREANVPEEMIEQFMRSPTMRYARRFQGMQ